MADIIILTIIGICVFFIIRGFVKKAKNKEFGCSCGCSSCSGCMNSCKSEKNANISN